jgi:rubrerythrin
MTEVNNQEHLERIAIGVEYRRKGKIMVTLAGTQKDIKSLVEAITNLEFDALEAYQETIERLENKNYARQIEEFKQDHLRHVEGLTKISKELNMKVGDGSVKSILTKGKIVIADLAGDDNAILTAMKTNEYDTVAAYENALKQNFLTPELRELCEKAAADERRHRDWMYETAKGDAPDEIAKSVERNR